MLTFEKIREECTPNKTVFVFNGRYFDFIGWNIQSTWEKILIWGVFNGRKSYHSFHEADIKSWPL